MIQLSNNHISVSALSAVWSNTDRQLAAAQFHTSDKVSMNAIKAELEKSSSRSGLSIGGDGRGWVDGAKHGFVHLQTTLEKANAHGHVMSLIHRNAHDPRMILATQKKGDGDEAVDQPHFYVVGRHGDDLETLFIERLQLALPWPLKSEWASMLLKLGTDNGLVEPLEVAIATEMRALMASKPEIKGAAFVNGLRVVRDSGEWGTLITSATQQEFIQI